jgi:Tol biopolymer transport system component
MKYLFLAAMIFPLVAVPGQTTGNDIVFTYGALNRYHGSVINSIRSDGTGQFTLAAAGSVNYSPNLSPDGTKVLYVKAYGEIWVTDANGTNHRRVTLPAGGSHFEPIWSPDGTQIAFLAGDAFTVQGIHVMNADGSNQRSLPLIPSWFSWSIDWSPDGSKIAFGTYCNAAEYCIYVMNADGTSPVRIPNTFSIWDGLSWSPDGTKFAYSDNVDIIIINSDGSSEVRIEAPGSDRFPSWSPDGTKLAFSSDRDGRFQIYTMNADGTNQVRITQNALHSTEPKWRRPLKASVSGRVVTDQGLGIRNAVVTLRDSSTTRTVITSSFGYFHFDNVSTGQTYTLGVQSRRFRFPTQTVTINSSMTDLVLVGTQ